MPGFSGSFALTTRSYTFNFGREVLGTANVAEPTVVYQGSDDLDLTNNVFLTTTQVHGLRTGRLTE
jgi:hypothetical protein